MIKNYLFVLLNLAFITTGYSQKERKVVFIIADGISADVIEQHDFHNLTKIKESGSYIRAFQGGENSSVRLPCLVSGSAALSHHVGVTRLRRTNFIIVKRTQASRLVFTLMQPG